VKWSPRQLGGTKGGGNLGEKKLGSDPKGGGGGFRVGDRTVPPHQGGDFPQTSPTRESGRKRRTERKGKGLQKTGGRPLPLKFPSQELTKRGYWGLTKVGEEGGREREKKGGSVGELTIETKR